MNNSIPNVRCLVVKVPFQAGKVLRRRPGVDCVFLEALFTGVRGGIFFSLRKTVFPGATAEKSCFQAEKVTGGGYDGFSGP